VKAPRPPGSTVLLPLFAILSLAAVAIGCVVASADGVAAATWYRNLAAWVLGALAAVAIARWGGRRTLIGFLVAAPVGLAATFLSAGSGGIHRWADLGPAHVNVAEVLLPPAVVACVTLAGSLRWAWGAAAVVAGLLIVQPDASQATAFGGALVVVATFLLGGIRRMGGMALAACSVVAAWLRPDPLAPVPTVEGIMALAWSLSPVVAILAGIALGGAVLAPLAASRSDHRPVRVAALTLAAYAVLSALAPLLGAFPVPLVGMGMSPILGLWLGIGLLTALAARPPAGRAP
jgi:hypothetical protein